MTQTYQTGFKTVLSASLTATGTTASLVSVPTVTKGRLLLKNGNIKEWVSFTGVSGSTVTGLTRGLSQTADPSTAGTGLEWGAGTQVILVAMHDQLPNKQEDIAFTGSVSATDVTFTGTTTGGLKVKSLTTVQRDAITPANGQIIYNTTAGEFQIYQGGAWSTMASGSTQPNASTTVAGKKEDPTDVESIAGTDVGGTGATMSPTCSQVAKNIQSGTFVYGTDVGGDDTYVVALTPTLAAYTAGQTLFFKPSTTNTGACTVDFGPGVKNIKTKDGNDPQSGVIRANMIVEVFYDGTNFVLATEDFATTNNKGVVEKATDVEAFSQTDTDRYVTPYHLSQQIQPIMRQSFFLMAGGSGSSWAPAWATCHKDGISNTNAFYVSGKNGGAATSLIHCYKFQDGFLYFSASVNPGVSSTSLYRRLWVIGDYLYTFQSTAQLLLRFDKDTLANQTTCTISGTALTGNSAIFSDGTDMYEVYSAGTAKKYTLSGTTFTSGSDTSYTSMSTSLQTWCDGTYVYQAADNDTGGNSAVYRWALAGGARTTINTSSIGTSVTSAYPTYVLKQYGKNIYVRGVLNDSYGGGAQFTVIPISSN